MIAITFTSSSIRYFLLEVRSFPYIFRQIPLHAPLERPPIFMAEEAPVSPIILIVEDDEDLRDTIVALVEQHGYRTVTAADSDSALELIASDQPIDLLFTDVVLPGEYDGVELARRAVDRRSDLRVLLTTGYDDDPDRISDHFAPWPVLGKPYQREELTVALTELLNETATAG